MTLHSAGRKKTSFQLVFHFLFLWNEFTHGFKAKTSNKPCINRPTPIFAGMFTAAFTHWQRLTKYSGKFWSHQKKKNPPTKPFFGRGRVLCIFWCIAGVKGHPETATSQWREFLNISCERCKNHNLTHRQWITKPSESWELMVDFDRGGLTESSKVVTDRSNPVCSLDGWLTDEQVVTKVCQSDFHKLNLFMGPFRCRVVSLGMAGMCWMLACTYRRAMLRSVSGTKLRLTYMVNWGRQAHVG